MKRLASLLLATLPVLAWADGDITGTVIGRETGEPVEFAVVQLISEKTGKATTIGANTDDQGKFTLKGVPDGRYSVQISSLGSVPQSRPVVISGANADIGTIRLADDTKLLQEVVVEGIKGQMRFELDKKVFNVDSNIAAAGVSASELLEAIPSVEVDQDGEISLRGNSSVTIWLNGKDSGLTADNRAQILEQIPAESIERVEVITNPSAKYSPEGTAGIINIILKKDRRAGYFGSAEIGGNSYGGGNVGANINFNTGKWESFAGAGFRLRRMTGGSESHRTYEGSDNYLNSEGDMTNRGHGIFLRLGTTFHADDHNDIYFSGFGMLGKHKSNNTTLYDQNLPGQWATNRNTTKGNGDMRGAHVELGYTHKWTDNHTLDINGSYNHWGGPNNNTFIQEMTFADEATPDEKIYQEQTMNMLFNGAEVKVDYTNQLNEKLKLEAGYNGNFSHENTPVTTLQGSTAADMVINPDLYHRFIYSNDTHALYTTFGGKFNKFSFSVGLRAEQWQVRTKSIEYGQTYAEATPYKKNDFALFPSAFISYALPKDNEIQINYTRRIRRPWGGMLNSFQDISNPTNISYGNPELAPQYANAFELNYIKSWTWHMLSISAYYRTTEHDMNRISYLDGDILYTTWDNVGTHTNLGGEIVGKNSFFNRTLDLTTTVNLYYNKVNAWSKIFRPNIEGVIKEFHVSGKGSSDFAWDFRMMASVRLPWGLSFQATGQYNSRQIMAQGSREAGWSVDAGLRKNLNNWSFSLNCRDIFDSRRMHSFTYGENYTQESKRWRGGRRLQLTIKYSFGNMKGKPNKQQMQAGGAEEMNTGYGDSMDM